MGVIPEESHYGIDKNLCYSYPCEVGPDGVWRIVDGLEINAFSQERMKKNEAELQSEKKMAFAK